MQDLTKGSIPGHIIRLAIPLGVGMLFQTLYFFVDLYFVSKLGDAAIAGVSAAGTVQFIIMSLTQILGVGTMVLISHASGRKDREDANIVFNQSVSLAVLCAVITLVGGYTLTTRYLSTVAADAETVAAGRAYLFAFLPGLALQFALVTMGSALRGTGIAKPTMVVQMSTVLLNAILAPIMIAGWGTGRPLGTMGAGISSTIAIAVGVLMLLAYFLRLDTFVKFHISMVRVRFSVWRRILRLGLPAGGEFALMFLSQATVYWIISDFGADAQAGYGVGSRVMQAIFLPAMALSFAAAPIAGQNVGANQPQRTLDTFRWAAFMGTALMFTLTLFCQWRADVLIQIFAKEASSLAVGTEFLRIISWNFVATGIIFTCSGMFQALGNTVPAVMSSAARLLLFAAPAVWLSMQPGFTLHALWVLSVGAGVAQLAVSLWLLRRELRRRLPAMLVPAPAAM